MSVDAIAHHMLPASPYDLWVRGDLADCLHIPDDGTRVEVVWGEIVLSPAPDLSHNGIVCDVQDAQVIARLANASYRWRCTHTSGLNLVFIGNGYVPDLILLDAKVLREARETHAKYLLPEQVELVMEVTSPGTAHLDRGPAGGKRRRTKLNGYASVGIPHYLLVDRDPRNPHVALMSDPDPSSRLYRSRSTWPFGGVIRLPDPFGFEIDTESWQPWSS